MPNFRIALQPCMLKNHSLILIILLLSISLNAIADSLKMNSGVNMNVDYGDMFTLVKNKKINFKDDLSFTLKYFSHKSSVDGKHTKASARVMVTQGESSYEILLSTYNTNTGKDIKDVDKFDKLYSHGYEFHLKGFDYGRSIDLVVQKSNRDGVRKLTDETYL